MRKEYKSIMRRGGEQNKESIFLATVTLQKHEFMWSCLVFHLRLRYFRSCNLAYGHATA